jgi:hypothetical protein
MSRLQQAWRVDMAATETSTWDDTALLEEGAGAQVHGPWQSVNVTAWQTWHWHKPHPL